MLGGIAQDDRGEMTYQRCREWSEGVVVRTKVDERVHEEGKEEPSEADRILSQHTVRSGSPSLRCLAHWHTGWCCACPLMAQCAGAAGAVVAGAGALTDGPGQPSAGCSHHRSLESCEALECLVRGISTWKPSEQELQDTYIPSHPSRYSTAW